MLDTIINNNHQLATLLENTVTHKISQEGLREVIEKTVANAIKKGIEKGSLYSMETLLSRVYASPKQEVDQTIKATLNIPNLPDIGNCALQDY